MGITKKRQAAYDARDKTAIEKRIANNEAKLAEKAKVASERALKKLEKQKIKDLQKKYGELEDQRTYGKNADAKKNARIDKEMAAIEEELRRKR